MKEFCYEMTTPNKSYRRRSMSDTRSLFINWYCGSDRCKQSSITIRICSKQFQLGILWNLDACHIYDLRLCEVWALIQWKYSKNQSLNFMKSIVNSLCTAITWCWVLQWVGEGVTKTGAKLNVKGYSQFSQILTNRVWFVWLDYKEWWGRWDEDSFLYSELSVQTADPGKAGKLHQHLYRL